MKDLTTKKLIVVGGPGGVGKTTLSASLGIALAAQGKRVAVLTVDPAKRLAQVLGIEKLGSELQEVPLAAILGKSTRGGSLQMSMLDAQRTFDQIVARYAPSPEQRDRILQNRLYRLMVEQLGGSLEYAAMELLLDYVKSEKFDTVVVDTPPTENAVELLRAPQRLADFMDQSVFRWFTGGTQLYLKIFKAGTKLAMRVLQQIFGSAFLEELSAFLGELESLQEGFRERQLEILDILKSPQTAFLAVSYPSQMRLRETEQLIQVLDEKGIALSGIVLNQVLPDLKVDASEAIPNALRPAFEYLVTTSGAERLWSGRFRKLASERHPAPSLVEIVRWRESSWDQSALVEVGQQLLR